MGSRIFVPDLIRMRQAGQKIAMLTAYDFSSAKLADASGVDVILVGDSLATVVQGHDNTLPVTLDEMIYHAKMVVRATERALVVVDLPFMSYQLGPKDALAAAGRVIKETGAGAVKLEGPAFSVVKRIVAAEIPVMGHLGLTPQAYHRMGGHKVQGREPNAADRLLNDAKRLEDAGAFSLVLEGIPAELASEITTAITIPTIGIGAGSACSGQVLVYHDIIGLTPFAGSQLPKFVKQYASLNQTITEALGTYVREVRSGIFPEARHSYSGKTVELQGVTPRKKQA